MVRYLFIAIVCIYLSSCKKSAVNKSNLYTIDTANYFQITFNGKTLVTTGILHNSISESHYAIINTFNDFSGLLTNFSIYASGSELDSALHKAGYNYGPQQCDVFLNLTKSGNVIGTYHLQSLDKSFIIDIVNHKNYQLSPLTSKFTITSVDTSYVQGFFNTNLGNGFGFDLPASGVFKLRK